MDLTKRISDSGFKLSYIACQLGITREGLYKKLRGNSEFKASEISKLVKLLQLTEEEIRYFFFNE